MTRLVSLWNRLLALARRDDEAAELEEEMRFHREMLEHDAMRAGASPTESSYAARRRLGNQTYLREESAEMWRIQPVETIAQDIRYALRFLRRSPVFTAVAILSLALGIGANTAIFTLINAVMVRALPVQEPGELVLLEPARGSENIQPVFPHPYFRTLEASNTVLDGIFAVSREAGVTIDRGNGPEQLPNGAALVSGKYFTTLGVRPAQGRLLGPGDDVTPKGHPVVVVSYDLWRTTFGSDASVVGRSIRVNGTPMTIVGVAPEGFFGTQVGERIDLYMPLLMAHVAHRTSESIALQERGDWWLYVMGRLKPGVTREQAAVELTTLFKRDILANPPFPSSNTKAMAQLQTARVLLSDASSGLAGLRRRFAKPLMVLAAMSAIVLLIACTNLASLLSARAAGRRKEIAIRLSMGAGRRRLLRQLLTESLLLSIGGALLGMAFASFGARALLAVAARGRAQLWISTTPDWRVLGFTTAIAIGTAILFGIVPAFQATKLELSPALRGGAATGRGRGTIRFGKLLIAAQFALSVLLVFGASLFVRSLQRLYTTDVGFDRSNVVVFRMDPRSVPREPAELALLYRDLVARVEALPGVGAATLTNHVPFSGAQSGFRGRVDGYVPPPDELADITRVIVADNYFQVMGIPLREGRYLSADDGASAAGPRTAVVNESFVRAYVPSKQAIGKRFYRGDADSIGTLIVGVVADAMFNSYRAPSPPVAYWTHAGGGWLNRASQALLVRVDPRIPSVTQSVRSAIAQLDRSITVTSVRRLDDQIDATISNERVVATLSGFFGAFALVLAMIGLYGLMAYAVTSRARDIGIRLALGAESSRVARSVLWEALGLVAIGLGLGTPAAVAASRVGQALLYGMTPGDAPTLLITAGLLALVAAIAASIPAWRASRIDPVGMLRSE